LKPGWTVQGVIDTFEPMVSDARRKRLCEVVAGRLDSVTVVMDAPHDPHNGAAIIRTCDALGIQTLHVIPREEAFLASSVVTKGSEQWVDVALHQTPGHALSQLRSDGFTLVGTHPQGELLPSELGKIPRLALVLGNEHDGICQELQRELDTSVRIAMRGFVESLNVSVSAAILLARATERRAGDLGEAQRQALYARWLLRSVARSADVLEALPPR
jgi:tRNA (guanosine-2'-O-)-methyltransferase